MKGIRIFEKTCFRAWRSLLAIALLLLDPAPASAWPTKPAAHQTAPPVTKAAWDRVGAIVRARLRADELLAPEHIEVGVSGLILNLAGRVQSREAARRALRIARAAAAPSMIVVDDMRVEPPAPRQDEIAIAAVDDLSRGGVAAVAVAVMGSTAILYGKVATEEDRGRLVEIARHTRGITRVVDRMRTEEERVSTTEGSKPR